MKGVRFYADLEGTKEDDGLGAHTLSQRTTRRQLREMAARGEKVNCVAVLLGEEHRNHHGFTQEAIISVFSYPDSDVAGSSVSRDYLRGCRHIDEATARKLHPRLFERLDNA